MTRNKELMRNATTAGERGKTYDVLARAFSAARPGLESEFTRLFIGPGRPVAYPYESAYLEGRVMGDCTLAVRGLYAEEGLRPCGDFLPDHVAVELGFMAHLARKEGEAREAGDEDGALACVREQESFLREHLSCWIPSFCQRVLVGEAHPFYADLAQRTWDQVAEDLALLRSCLRDGAAGSADGHDSWTASVGPVCTLCGLCTQLCEPGALRLTTEDSEVRLLFDAAICDGCAACEQRCPERAVRVESSAGLEVTEVLLMSSALAVCPDCGEPSAPAILLNRVQERAAADDEGLRRRLALCLRCRTFSPCTSLAEEDR